MIRLFEDMRQILPQSSVDDLANIIFYKNELKNLGIGSLELANLSSISQKFGGLNGMLQAISGFNTLQSIQDETNIASAEKEKLDTKLSSMQLEVEKLQGSKEAIQSSLRVYEDLKAIGFDNPILSALAQTCKKYGGSVKQVLNAVYAYGNLTEIQTKIKEIEMNKQRVEIELREKEAEHAHLQTILHMCSTLLYDFKYSVDAIRELHEMARRYGEPVEVFKAVGRYGELKKIEEDIENLSKNKIELETKIRELKMQLQSLKGEAETVKESVTGLLEPLSAEIGKTVANAFQKLTSAYTEQLEIVKNESDNYGQRLGQAIALQDELNLARIINSLEKYPAEATRLDSNFALLLLDAVYKYCLVNDIRRMITLKDALFTVSNINSGTEVYVSKLVDGARRALLGFTRAAT
jgi:predicted  nucleic acid-binding Zn-ribbon protein